MNRLKKNITPLLIVLGTLLLVVWMNSGEDLRIRPNIVDISPEVSVVRLEPQTLSLDIKTTGVVTARTQLRILPEVSGKVTWVNPKWQNGGFFSEGETFLKVEKHQYRNNVAKAKAQLAEANARYVQEQGMVNVAKKEWDQRRNKSTDKAAKSLALRQPQYASAKAQYEAAKSDLLIAELSLRRTELKAPFDGIVLKRTADIGQLISANQAIAEFYAVDYAEVRVPLTESSQHLIDIPSLHNDVETPVIIDFADKSGITKYNAILTRTESVLDEVTKVLYGVVVIEDPYQLKSDKSLKPLRIGSYVSVHVPGRDIRGLYALPDTSLRHGNQVYIVDAESKLQLKDVDLLPNYNGLTLVANGLGDTAVDVVVGRVGEAAQGKLVSIKDNEPVEKE